MQNSLFDLENRYPSLSEAGGPLERLDAVIDWKIFRLLLKRIDAKEPKTAAGRRPICRLSMLKLLILQRLHNLSDGQLQYQASVHDLNPSPSRQKPGIVLRATKVGALETRTTTKSQVRARVEPVFGHRGNRMGGLFLRSIGKARAKVGVGLMDLTGNLTRIEMLTREKIFGLGRINAIQSGNFRK